MANIVKVECECGQLARVNEIASGSISTSCPGCKSQRFYKSPAAVAAFRKKYGATEPTQAAPASPAKIGGGILEGL